MLRRLAHPQTARQFARSFHNLQLRRPGHQPWPNRLYRPAVFGVTRLSDQWGSQNTVVSYHTPWGGQVAGFHSTRKNEALPFMPFFAAILKVSLSRMRAFADTNPVLQTSTSIEVARTAGRVALSLAPFLLMKNRRSRKRLQKNLPGMEEERPVILQKIRARTILFHLLIFTPILLVCATIVASLERTPLTGRYVFYRVPHPRRDYLYSSTFLLGGDSFCYRQKKRIK